MRDLITLPYPARLTKFVDLLQKFHRSGLKNLLYGLLKFKLLIDTRDGQRRYRSYAETAAIALLTCWISKFDYPTDIVTDRGKQFESTLFQHLARELDFTTDEQQDTIQPDG
ncbi:hypothetical protein EVAR_31048_1 [Eumeta japonica]|uniref:Integrase catalytic domain-containing protein n=1 Tax=Eumeta variegata TaxID=151549 RepID=A0A4C1VES2_EUMVA|nr:hypothetical protein EVAR_31048_1 [Eumeta japonica]